jgi:hypothetical protein
MRRNTVQQILKADVRRARGMCCKFIIKDCTPASYIFFCFHFGIWKWRWVKCINILMYVYFDTGALPEYSDIFCDDNKELRSLNKNEQRLV